MDLVTTLFIISTSPVIVSFSTFAPGRISSWVSLRNPVVELVYNELTEILSHPFRRRTILHLRRQVSSNLFTLGPSSIPNVFCLTTFFLLPPGGTDHSEHQ